MESGDLPSYTRGRHYRGHRMSGALNHMEGVAEQLHGQDSHDDFVWLANIGRDREER